MAASNKSKKKDSRKEKQTRFSFLSDMDPDVKSLIYKVAGVLVGIFAVITLIGTASYLFTWQADQSLEYHQNMMSQDVDVSNAGGKLGYKWGSFLVRNFLGLGSFAFVFLLGAVAYRLFFWNRSIGLFRISMICVSGAFISSLILAYISDIFALGNLFGGGLGGYSGHAVVLWMNNLVGGIVTGLVICVLVIVWLVLSSRRFAHWFAVAGMEKKEKPVKETETSAEVPVDTEDVVPVQEEVLEPISEFGQPEVEFEHENEYEPIPFADDEPEEIVIENPEPEEVVIETPETVEEEPENPSMDVEITYDPDAPVQEPLPRIDNRADLERYEFPSLDLLDDYSEGQHSVSQEELEINNNRIRATLLNYKIDVQHVSAVVGPTVTLYKVVPAPGVKVSSIEMLHREIGMSLGAKGVRVVVLPDCVGIEVANREPSIVPLKKTLGNEAFTQTKYELPIAIGYTITKKVKTFDLASAPHLLVAGATQQGKSVGLNVIIASLLYAKHPSELKFVFIDPKMVEFTSYNSLLKHYLAVLPMAASEEDEREHAIVKDAKHAEEVLNSLCIEMDERYKLLALAGVNKLTLYNEKYRDRHLLPTDGHKYLPYLVVVIDEYADLTMAGGAGPEARKAAKNIEASIVRLAQKGRAAGIHVIIATQRPSVNVITGLIKTNFPTRIAFRVVSRVDSATILDSNGAENLIGRGDMLYYSGVEMERVQCALVSMAEINKLTDFIGKQSGYKQCYNTPYYLPVPESQDGETSGGSIDMNNIDPMFEDAARMVVTTQKGSTSDLQRRLGMGYARAGRVMDQLEGAGIVGPQEGSKPRQVLVASLEELDEVLSHFIH